MDQIKVRLDAEYYRKSYLEIDQKIKSIGVTNLIKINAKIDCSAFYPSITEYYNFEGNGIPFLRVNEIKEGLVNITDSTAYLPEHVLDNNKSTITVGYSGDLIIAKGGNTLAKVGLITSQYEKYALSRDIILIRTSNLVNYNRYFLWLFLHSNYGQALLWRTASQTGQPHLTLPSIKEIYLPKFGIELEAITEKLYLESVRLANKSKTIFQKADRILLQEIGLEDFEPSKEPINIKSFKDSFVNFERLDAEYYQKKYEDLINVLTQQSHNQLSNLVEVNKSIEPGSANYSDEGVPFIRVSDYDKFGFSKPDKYLKEKFVEENKKLLEKIKPRKGTILFSKDGSVGCSYHLREDKDFITSGAILHLKVKDENTVLPEYLTLVLNSKAVQMQAERDAGGSIILHWRVSEIEDVVIPIIDLSKQKEIAELVEESFKLKRNSEKILETAKKTVEIAIEESEEIALDYIKRELDN